VQNQEGEGWLRQRPKATGGSLQVQRPYSCANNQDYIIAMCPALGMGSSQELQAMPRYPSQSSTLSRSQWSLFFRMEISTSHTLVHLLCFLGQVDPVKLRQAIHTVLFNQYMISLPMVVFLYPFLKWLGDPCRQELPTFHWFLLELAIFTLMEEVLFYYSHR
jgi:hypothetical protein